MSKEMMAVLEQIAKNTDGFARSLKDLKTGQEKMRGDVADALARIEALEKGHKPRGVSLPGSDEETFRGKRFSYVKAVRFALTGNEKGNELEAAIMREATEKGLVERDMSASSDSEGGLLIPHEVVNDLIENLRAETVLLQAGATLMSGLQGSPVSIPKKTGNTQGYWVGETEAPTTSDLALGMKDMTPHTAAAWTKLSRRLVMLSSPAAEGLVRADLTETMSLLLDGAGLRGSGAEGEPIGVANTSGILSYAIGTNGGPISYEVLVNILSQARNNNALRNGKRVGWVMSPQVVQMIQLMTDSNGRPLLLASTEAVTSKALAEMGAIGMLLGYPVWSTTQVPVNLTKGTGTALSEIYFGDWSTVIIGQWGGLELRVSDTAGDALQKRQVWVFVFQDVDTVLRQPERMVLCNDVESTAD